MRFIPRAESHIVLIGQPVDNNVDVGAALHEEKEVKVEVFSGTSVLNPGQVTGRYETIGRVLSPLSEEEIGTIRCIGLNVLLSISRTPSPETGLLISRLVPSACPRGQLSSANGTDSIPVLSCLYSQDATVVMTK